MQSAAAGLGAADRTHVALPAVAAVHGTEWMAPRRSSLWRLGHGRCATDAAEHGSRGSFHDAARARSVARRRCALVRSSVRARAGVYRAMPEHWRRRWLLLLH